MLQLVSSKQLIMKPREDQTLNGQITIANNSKGCYIPYKIKSTNPNLFSVQPNRGILSQKQTVSIQISTVDPINHQMAKQLSQKHKFLVEYVILDRQPRTLQEGMSKIYGPTVQHFRVYINTDSVRGSKVSNNNNGYRDRDEVGSNISNKYSFHSAYNGLPPNSGKGNQFQNQNGRGFFKSTNLVNNMNSNTNINSPQRSTYNGDSNNNNHHPDSLQQLKAQVDFLEQQRSQLLLGTGKKKPKNGGFFKKIIIFAIGMIVGNIGVKLALPTNQQTQNYYQQEAHSGSGWFSSEQPQQPSSWW